jgi:hypothetical protein
MFKKGFTLLLETFSPFGGENRRVKRGKALGGGNPPVSPFAKGGELLPFLKGEREGFKQGRVKERRSLS